MDNISLQPDNMPAASNSSPAAPSPRSLPTLAALPRPLYARAESLPAGSFSPAHRHPWAQLTYAIEGVLDIRTPDGSYVALPQCAVWIPAEVEHQVLTFSRAEMRSFYLDPAALPWPSRTCRVLQVTPLVRELMRHASALPAEYREDGPEGRLVQVLLDQLALLPEAVFSLPLPQDARLIRIHQALQVHPDDSRGLAQWAAALGMSDRNLARLFRRDTGLSFRLWRQRLRLMLSLGGLEGGHSVTRVALDCGYESPSAYIAAFKQLFGRTPGELFG
jgi:AraC-like DNA-binding protein